MDVDQPLVSSDVKPREAVLAEARDMLLPRLRECVGWLAEPVRTMATYHFGWTDRHGEPVELTGSSLRLGTLVLLSATLDGGPWERARDAAVAWTLMGNQTLIHDDILDKDQVRRDRPALWAEFGTPAAVQAGDALLALAFEALAARPGPHTAEAVRVLAAAAHEVCAGQVLDVQLEDCPGATFEEALGVVEAKTSSLLRCVCRLGALHSAATRDQVDAITEFGGHVGVAWQLLDDFEDVWGDPGQETEPPRSDLRTRKKTLAVLTALRSDHPCRDELSAFYRSTHPAGDDELRHVAALIERCGGRAWCEAEIDRRLAAARRSLQHAAPVTRIRRGIADYTSFITRRSLAPGAR
ncbi:putative polyprenyl diphosphate synthase [Streptomyces sp. NBRC 110611]|uniref:polyprenyl synthetase family protein n=1 Tax=Streptomyces sp. NBRC 110611 TaxID=1621259 RepID=UPI00082CE26F|nr:polyprenyl synthetase family protein [Streptomyces sp. NBRC 110611]GAU70692.1 putative polyprenyl diphosphate synthase [Streptomyces sp. NBRC 110611]